MAKVIVKKKWYKIIAPKLFNEVEVGETPSIEAKLIEGKVVTANMFVLTDNMKRQNTEVRLLVERVEGEKAFTTPIGMKIIPTSIKRLVRKGKSRLDQAMRGITKDDKVVMVKTLFITKNIVKGSVFSGLQNYSRAFLMKAIQDFTYEELTTKIVTGELQKELREKLSKIYPLKICEIKEFKLERFATSVEIRRIKELMAQQKEIPVAEPEEEIVEETEVQA